MASEDENPATRNLLTGASYHLAFGKDASLPLEGKVLRNEADEVFYPCKNPKFADGSKKEIPQLMF